MSPQVSYALKRAATLMLIAVLGVAANEYTNVLDSFGDYAWAGPIVVALIGAALRWAEGLKDAGRASAGELQKSDVGFDVAVYELAAQDPNAAAAAVREGKVQI